MRIHCELWYIIPDMSMKHHTPSDDGLDLTMKGTQHIMFDYCYIPLGTYFKLSAQAGFMSNFQKIPLFMFLVHR